MGHTTDIAVWAPVVERERVVCVHMYVWRNQFIHVHVILYSSDSLTRRAPRELIIKNSLVVTYTRTYDLEITII